MRSTKDKLVMTLLELQNLVRALVNSVHAQTVNSPQSMISTDQFTSQIIDKQNIINEIIKEAQEQEELQKQIEQEKQEYNRLEQEVNKLQQQLRSSQQVLEMVVASANEKTEVTHKVKERQCTVKDLLNYSHLISSSFSNQMPGNWTEMDYRRPWPTDLDMRAGELGKLAIRSGMIPQLEEGVLAEREAQVANPWKPQQPMTHVSELAATEVTLTAHKQDMSSSSDEDGDNIMEDVT